MSDQTTDRIEDLERRPKALESERLPDRVAALESDRDEAEALRREQAGKEFGAKGEGER